MKQSETLERISFHDILDVTEEEIEATDALLSSSDKYTYEACLSSKAFKLPDGALESVFKFKDISKSAIIGR